MIREKITRSWEEFLSFSETAEADKYSCEKAKRIYARRGMCQQVISAARMAGFIFEEEIKIFTPEEKRWISIFEEMENIQYTLRYLCKDSDESADVFGAVSGAYRDDGSVAERIRQLSSRLRELEAERKTLHEVEDDLYPQPVAYGLPRYKRWLA